MFYMKWTAVQIRELSCLDMKPIELKSHVEKIWKISGDYENCYNPRVTTSEHILAFPLEARRDKHLWWKKFITCALCNVTCCIISLCMPTYSEAASKWSLRHLIDIIRWKHIRDNYGNYKSLLFALSLWQEGCHINHFKQTKSCCLFP